MSAVILSAKENPLERPIAHKLEAGAILIEGGALLPDSLQLESVPCSNGWRLVENLDCHALDRQVRAAGWTFFFLAGEVKANVFGFDADEAKQEAIRRLLRGQESDKLNCLELTQVVTKRFLGMPYVSVSAHSRHIQESMFLSPASRLAKKGRTGRAAF